MKTTGFFAIGLLGAAAALGAGCVEHRVVYVPTYRPAPVYYQTQPAYTYPPQTTYQAQPSVTQQAPAQPAQEAPAASQPAPPPPQPSSPPGQVVVSQPPPAPQVEVVPVAPGPDYAWTPGYWTWNGGWVWVGGAWALRPRHYAVWVGPHWVRHGHGYVWVGGYWR
jgi:WXXGXW repeat (2 copies)